MKNEFILAFNEVLEEKQLPKELIIEALNAAMVSAYRRSVNASNAQQIDAEIDLETGKFTIYAEKEVVEAVQDDRTEVALEDALTINPITQVGEMVVVNSTPKDFGRVAAQTARQVIQQRIREAERDAQLSYFEKQLGEIVNGTVQAVNAQGATLGLDMKAEGTLPRNQMISSERFRVHDRVRALLLEVKDTPRGPQIVLSRAHRNFLRRLLENEVPEIYHGMVEIRSISREPGQRSKVAVSAIQPGVDPVGACVGIRGVRIQAIVKELNDEKIDVIEWNPDPVTYIAKALSPARVTGVYPNEHSKGIKTATVVVPEDQLSLAIGRDGQNARLAAKLTSWRIDIKSLPEATVDAVYKLQNDPEYSRFAEQESEILPQIENILAKKTEGRPVTPEEYQVLTHFIDRIERGLISRGVKAATEKEEREKLAMATIPSTAFEIPLEDLGLPLRFSTLLAGAGYLTVGDLMLQMKLEANKILGLDGIGARAMQAIEETLSKVSFPEPEKILEEIPSEPIFIEGIASSLKDDLITETFEKPVEVLDEVEGKEGISEDFIGAETALISSETIAPAEELVSESGIPIELGVSSQGVSDVIETQQVELVPEQIPALDKLFALTPEALGIAKNLEDEDEEEDEDKSKKTKVKRKKYMELEYDPEKEVVLAKKKRKRADGTWEGEW